MGRIPDRIPESDFSDKSDLEGWFALSHQRGSKRPEDCRYSTVLIFSPKRWRKKFMEVKPSCSIGDEPSPEASTDTKLTPETSPLAAYVSRDVNPRPWPIPPNPLDLNSRDLGGVLPRVSLSPTIELEETKQATPTQETIGSSTDSSPISLRTSKRARCPPPLDIESISSYSIFVSRARRYGASEMKARKKGGHGLGLGLPSIAGGQKPTRMKSDNHLHSLDVVGSPQRRSFSLHGPEVAPGPASAPCFLQFPPSPQLQPIDLVDVLDHTPSPLNLPPPICAAKSWKAKSAPACQLYFDRISGSSSARTRRSLSAKAPTPTAISSHPISHTRLVVPPPHRRTSSYLKEAIASLHGGALHSPIPPSLVGTPYLESVSSPFSPHFQPHGGIRRAASEVLRQGASVDVDEMDEHWSDANVPLSRLLPQRIGSSSISARQSSGGRVGKGPSGRRKKPLRKEAKIASNPYFADAEHTHSTLWTVLRGARGGHGLDAVTC